MKLVMATKNPNKIREASSILDTHIISMEDAGIHNGYDESGVTYEENSMIKAVGVMNACGLPALADDSGLEIDFLQGEPGVFSSRFLGEDTPPDEKNKRILDLLKGIPKAKRGARFVCVISVALPDKRRFISRGEVYGYIGYEPKGNNGFGYDPIFYLYENGSSFAEMKPEQKNDISHRCIALLKMKKTLIENNIYDMLY